MTKKKPVKKKKPIIPAFKAGRPPAFNTPEELQAAILKYFREGVTEKEVIIGSGSKARKVKVPVPTICGLCFFIGFESRQSFYDYEKKEGFTYTIKRARLFIESHYEELLQATGSTAAIFALKNFGWKDQQIIDQTVREVKVTIEDD